MFALVLRCPASHSAGDPHVCFLHTGARLGSMCFARGFEGGGGGVFICPHSGPFLSKYHHFGLVADFHFSKFDSVRLFTSLLLPLPSPRLPFVAAARFSFSKSCVLAHAAAFLFINVPHSFIRCCSLLMHFLWK